MATSGTVGQTFVPVARLMEGALRRAGVFSPTMVPETFRAAADCLYELCISLSNGGVNLWCIESVTQGTLNAQYQYTLPDGTLDVLKGIYRQNSLPSGGTPGSSSGVAANAFDQDLTTFCQQSAPNGYISYQFPNAIMIDNVGINAYGNNIYNLVYEYSNDGVTWSTLFTPPANTAYTDGQWTCYDIPFTVSATYYRVRETGGATLSAREVCFNQTFFENILGRYNFDSYTSLPQKYQTQRQVTNFWLDRTRGNNDNPVAYVWPVSNYNFDQLVWWRHRHIQDVGSLSNEIEVPMRWIDALKAGLSRRLCLEIPGADMGRYATLKAEEKEAFILADMDETDDSPGYLIPDTTCYTI